MQLIFEVGSQERHVVVFNWDQFWGRLKITVDGVDVVKSVEFASFKLVKAYDFNVGQYERHHVRIEKHRQLFFAGFRPQPVYAYVDGLLVASGEGQLI